MRRFLLSVLPLLALGACIVEAPSEEGALTGKPRAAKQLPPLSVPSGAVLGDKVKLVGARFDPGQMGPGEIVRVSLSFEVLEEMKEDYLIFVHVEDPKNPSERFNADHRPQSGKHPTTLWKKGERIRDDFQILLPPTFRARTANVWIGFWEASQDQRLPLRNPDAVRNDGKDRILLANLPLAGG